MTQAILGNAAHPEYGVATIPFPIPRAEYANCVALLEALEIGDARDRDCQVREICGPLPALKRLEEQLVNLDELDYLAKRLDSFTGPYSAPALPKRRTFASAWRTASFPLRRILSRTGLFFASKSNPLRWASIWFWVQPWKRAHLFYVNFAGKGT